MGQPSLNAPRAPKMFDERLRSVLNEHVNGVDAGVQKIAQDEIDNAVFGGEGHSRLASVLGKRHEPFSLAAGHDHRENFGLTRRHNDSTIRAGSHPTQVYILHASAKPPLRAAPAVKRLGLRIGKEESHFEGCVCNLSLDRQSVQDKHRLKKMEIL